MGGNPNLTLGQVPSPANWNGYFTAKQDDIALLSSPQLLALANLIVPVFLASLPTSLPASAGQWWNDGGTLAQS